jgi:hypothetical protein
MMFQSKPMKKLQKRTCANIMIKIKPAKKLLARTCVNMMFKIKPVNNFLVPGEDMCEHDVQD